MADTRDLKSLVKYLTCGFESRSWHQVSPKELSTDYAFIDFFRFVCFSRFRNRGG